MTLPQSAWFGLAHGHSAYCDAHAPFAALATQAGQVASMPIPAQAAEHSDAHCSHAHSSNAAVGMANSGEQRPSPTQSQQVPSPGQQPALEYAGHPPPIPEDELMELPVPVAPPEPAGPLVLLPQAAMVVSQPRVMIARGARILEVMWRTLAWIGHDEKMNRILPNARCRAISAAAMKAGYNFIGGRVRARRARAPAGASSGVEVLVGVLVLAGRVQVQPACASSAATNCSGRSGVIRRGRPDFLSTMTMRSVLEM
jgi:hypothetical protein